ncbi:hypothetical protein SKAU_G00419150 [Synaphobranchus kaupii]|uniref:Uncharacterized protein n=1 Tax=Synaphobranchus kaupii TaxID=118154 RepID=A0A9Q1E6A3_SYNKA|nr:hypothetical protein SKAU_G00419150 [Synaphobranchus kaupii]
MCQAERLCNVFQPVIVPFRSCNSGPGRRSEEAGVDVPRGFLLSERLFGKFLLQSGLWYSELPLERYPQNPIVGPASAAPVPGCERGQPKTCGAPMTGSPNAVFYGSVIGRPALRGAEGCFKGRSVTRAIFLMHTLTLGPHRLCEADRFGPSCEFSRQERCKNNGDER